MDRKEQQFAKFYAHVATVYAFRQAFSAASDEERKKLWDLMFAEFNRLLATNPEPEGLPPPVGGLEFPGDDDAKCCADGDRLFPYETSEQMAAAVYNTMESQVGLLLGLLLDGKPASPRWEYLDHAPHLSWRVDNGKLSETWEAEWSEFTIERLHRRAIEPLISLIRKSKPAFPFGRCPTCSTVFVRVRRQKYCKQQCASSAIEAGRKDQKREYMRQYMAERRKRARRKKRRG